MARTFGRIAVRIWHDKDFLALDSDAQLTYMFLSTQGQITMAGVLAVTRRKWADKLFAGDVDRLDAALRELHDKRFVVLDEQAEELLVRTFVKHDGGYKSPSQRQGVLASIENITSTRILVSLAIELDRLQVAHGILVDPDDDPSPDPSQAPSEAPSEEISKDPSDDPALGSLVKAKALASVPALGKPEPDPLTTTEAITTSSSAEERADVETICVTLADRIEGNGAKRPKITKDWRTQARLMIDRDGRTLEQVLGAIQWSQDHPFWHTNILSVPKLRAQYDQLELKAKAEARQRQDEKAPKRTTDDRVRDGYGIAQRLAEQERTANRQLERNPS